MAVLKELILTVSNLRGCGCLQRTEFYSFYFREGVVVLKERDLTILTWECVVVLKGLILTLSTLGRYGSIERTEFNSFYFGKVWQS